MKFLDHIKQRSGNREYLFYFFLAILITPNILLFFTEPMPVAARICNILLPFACYYLLMILSRNSGKMFWLLFPFLFFGAFQIVLLYLFRQSIIAVDMFLNLATTNSNEAMELLDNLVPALVGVVLLYVPALVGATVSVMKGWKQSPEFIRRERRRALVALVAGLISLGVACRMDGRYELKSDLYPANVCYNVYLAFQRNAQTRAYHRTSEDFAFNSRATHPEEKREIYVMVVGETSRATNWRLYGYARNTNPQLSGMAGVASFSHALTESNTTHKSVPMLLSAVSACNFDSIYHQKGIITAFKEAGFRTAFFSNQRRNHSFIDFFGQEADTVDFIREDAGDANYNPSDDELLERVAEELAKGNRKQFVVLHTYGSHFNYRERYPEDQAFFLPDFPVDAERKYRENLVNAYDNSIRYTDSFLARVIRLLEGQTADAVLLYVSDHGEDIFDDDRHLFLHASPVPSYYQLHVPLLLWMSDGYRAAYPEKWKAALQNQQKSVSSSASCFPTMLELAGIETPYRNDSLSVASPAYTEYPSVYLNDHNEPRALDDIGMGEEDFRMLRKKGIYHSDILHF